MCTIVLGYYDVIQILKSKQTTKRFSSCLDSLFSNLNSLSLELRDSGIGSTSISSGLSFASSISEISDLSMDNRSRNKTEMSKDIRTESNSMSTPQPLYSTFRHPREYGISLKDVRTDADSAVQDIELPPHLTEKQFDAVLLHHEDDQREAILFKEVIEKFIVLGDGRPAQIGTLDKSLYLGWIQSRTKHLEEAVKRSTYIFLFVTDNFVKDTWAELQKDECLQESIEVSVCGGEGGQWKGSTFVGEGEHICGEGGAHLWDGPITL